jgi:hypothetical protein
MVAVSSRERAAAALQGIRSNGVPWLLGSRVLHDLVLGIESDGMSSAMPRAVKRKHRDAGYMQLFLPRLVEQLWFAGSEE